MANLYTFKREIRHFPRIQVSLSDQHIHNVLNFSRYVTKRSMKGFSTRKDFSSEPDKLVRESAYYKNDSYRAFILEG
jgi:hypothetical protein